VVLDWFIWLGWRLRPRPGWLPFFLLLTLVGTLAEAIIMARWIPEVNRVAGIALTGFLLGTVLALRPLKTGWAWGLLFAYGIPLTIMSVGRLWPPLRLWFAGWNANSEFIRRQMVLLVARISTWGEAVARDQASQETAVFAVLLGFLVWLLAAYAAWTTFRQLQPLRGLTPLGVALAVNHTFSDVDIWPVLLFIPLAVLLAAAIHFYTLQEDWERRGVDYSTEIKVEQLAAAAAIALILLLLAYGIPNIRLSAIAQAFRQAPAVQEAEAVVERAFAGVRQPDRAGELAAAADPGDGEVADGLPRALLMGNPPELLTTLVMTATVVTPENSADLAANWRGLSYDVYTGRGWTVSQWDDTSAIAANQPILNQQSASANRLITQTVQWQLDDRQMRYSLGLPVRLAERVTVTWHGEADPARVQGEGGAVYQVTSVIPAVNEERLRQSDAAAIPAPILAQYTALPANLPARVRQLASDIVAEAPTAYDQAIALEQFLRQYSYSLTVSPPPANTDLVDYFLFDLQRGYCDYYASAMVVMARSLDIPARLVVGYTAQPPNARGEQRIVLADAHSWPELYFAAVGWVAFEPTAAYPTWGESPRPELNAAASPPLPTPLTIPPRQPAPVFPWLAVLGLVAVGVGWWGWWRWQARQQQIDDVVWAYARLQRRATQLAQPPRPSQTPAEFSQSLETHLQQQPWRPWQVKRLTQLFPALQRLTALYNDHQYAAAKPPPSGEGFKLWQTMARPLGWVIMWRKMARPKNKKE